MAHCIDEGNPREWWHEDNPPAWEPGPDDYAELDEARILAELEHARKETKLKAFEQLSNWVESLQQMNGCEGW